MYIRQLKFCFNIKDDFSYRSAALFHYSEVIEVLKQHIKSHERVIASQSSDIKTLLLSLNTLKASVEDSVSAIKNISSTLASLTNSSNAATTGKTSYDPRFDPFSGTMDLDSPPRPPRKEPHLGPAIDNTATSNLDPPIDIGSKEGFKDTITSSIVKELSKKAYTIPDNSKLSGESNFEQWIQALKSKKEDVYNEFHALTFSTYKKGLSAFNAEFNGYLAQLTMAKIDIDPSLILNQYFKALESKFPSWVLRQKSSIRQARMLGLIASSLNIEYLMADILEESRNPAIEAYRAAYIANSSHSTPNSNSNPSKKGKNKKKGKKKASYNIKGQNYSTKSAEQASFILGSYNLAIEEEEEESDSSSNSNNQPRRRPRDPALYNSWLYDTGSTDYISNSKERPAGIGSITLEVLSRKAPPTYTKLVLDNVLYLPNIDINIISGVRHYDSGGCLIKETLYGGDRRCIAVLDFKKSGFFLNSKGSSKPILYANFAFPLGLSSYTTKSIELQRYKIVVEIPSNSIRKEDYRPIIKDAIVSEAIEPNKRYKLRNSPAKGTTLEGVGPSLRGKRPRRPTREPKPLTGTGDLPRVLREPVIEGNEVEKAISSLTLKEPNIADLGQSSRPLPPIQTLSEDEKDGEDYSEVIEVLKQHIKSHERVIASQSSDIKTLLLSLNTLKASVEDSVSAIKNISSTLASLTNSSNATATGKTSYSPRFDPFSGTMDLDSPPRPPRKEPHLGPAIDNTATSNLDPPIDIGSKEGFKDTITSSIVKELSKKAYTIPDDNKLSRESNFEQWIQALSIVLRALGISNFLENPDISNTYSDSNQAVLLMLLRNSLSSSPRAAISRPIKTGQQTHEKVGAAV
ncbi:hypothetical protein P8C59_000716 [Phyllachora maydis]|uniref:Uncharacterized protein n=1 Tax=Phyllachora maydis TaxID=1825666 RepID=A0AAD9HWP4_9PEZI|nr:hypothetical protein P8C59_000716 [Phyllachora maydis]